MAERKYLDDAGLDEVAQHVNKRLKVVSVMPDSADVGAVRLYTGATSADYTKGGIYQYNGTDWELINATAEGTAVYIGTVTEWEQMTDDQKAQYNTTYFLDDIASGFMNVSDIVQAEDYNAVTSNAVAEAIADIQAVIPSTASASNQLVTASDNTNAPITVLKASSSNVVDFDDLVPDNLTISSRKIFMVISDNTNVVNSPRSTRNMIVICYNTVGNIARQNQIAISEDGTKQMWQRNCTGGTWSTWTEFLTGDMLTSSVTSGSTAPVTSGGVWTALNRTTLKDWTQDTGAAILYNCAFNWGLSTGTNVVCEVVAADANSIADNYHGIIKFVYGGSNAISGVTYHKLGGTGTINATNAGGTVEFSFANGNPKVSMRYMGTA